MRISTRGKAPSWSREEIAILCELYPEGGLEAVADQLSERSWNAITTMASKLRLRSPILGNAPVPVLAGESLEEAIRLREVEGWSYIRIGKHFGVAETSASNAILIALCPRKGFRPAERDSKGRLMPEGLERLRIMLRVGMKAVDIQLQLGVSAGCVAEQRRRYRVELRQRGKAPLPLPGNGTRYSGARISRDVFKQVDELLLTGLGTPKVADRTGISKTHCQRRRAKLIRKLKRRGECIPGCDINGRRRRIVEHALQIPASTIEALRQHLLDGMPVSRAARVVGIGSCSAYKFRDELAAELLAEGKALPTPIRRGRHDHAPTGEEAGWLPKEKAAFVRFRKLCREHGDVEGKRLMQAELAAARALEMQAQAAAQQRARDERKRPLTFEEQLARVAAGARLVTRVPLPRSDYGMTLGGVGSGML